MMNPSQLDALADRLAKHFPDFSNAKIEALVDSTGDRPQMNAAGDVIGEFRGEPVIIPAAVYFGPEE